MATRRAFLAAAGLIPALASPVARAESPGAARAGGMAVRRWAWAGISLRVGAVELFIDARAPDPDDGAPGPPLASDAPRRFALATHRHGDHLDLGALAALLDERGYLVVHDDVARLFDDARVRVQPARLFEPVFLSRGGGEFVAFAVPASDGLGSPQNAWVVDGGGQRVIHCGDTLWHGAWWDIARAYGPFDAAFLPINGARPLGGQIPDPGLPMVMNAEQAAAAAAALGARLAVPIHYGAVSTPEYVQDLDAESRFLAAAAAKGIATRVLKPGEQLMLGAGS
jgi:L-ascorbate metabolism protein UlaG (beta-lactamase superfamily)